MNYVVYAIPFFVLAVLLELVWGLARQRNTYQLADTLNSLQLGTLSRLRGVLHLGLLGVTFEAATGGWGLFDIDASNPWVWASVFVAYDLCYYFSHRYGHEWRILWASHVVHHQSEEFNLSTALRQTSTGWLNGVFYLPLYVLGVPVELMISVGSLNLIYQFWVHTEHVRRLGVLEWVLVTPSNHRVHHAKNPQYLDRNYGGVFIVWDRLFGTFQDELPSEPCRYGTTRQLASWNPVWANVHIWGDGLRQMWVTPRWRDKVGLWFKSPAWDAPGVVYPPASWQAQKFRPTSSVYTQVLSFVHFVLHVVAVLSFVDVASAWPPVEVVLTAIWLTFGFVVQGYLLEGRAEAFGWELLRVASGLALALFVLTQIDPGPLSAYCGLSFLAALPLLRDRKVSPSMQQGAEPSFETES